MSYALALGAVLLVSGVTVLAVFRHRGSATRG